MDVYDYKGQYYVYCDAWEKDYKSLSKAVYYFTDWHKQYSFTETESLSMEIFDRKALDSLESISHIFFTIATLVCWFLIARLLTQLYVNSTGNKSLWTRFFLEFSIIALPCILCVTVYNKWVEVIVIVKFLMLCLIVWRSKCFEKAQAIKFDLGARPHIYTLLRSTVYIWTVLCILAIDFEGFPKKFRKSRSYGASLMDVGIGLFITVMAMVSKRLTSFRACKNTIIATVALLILGSLRTAVVMYLNYGQDKHEYGEHLNAFFILGFTKLFGSLFSAMARTDVQLLPLSVGVIALHELILQCGLQDYVIDPFGRRDSFYDANREGFSSIPGFVGLYLLCICIYKNLDIKGTFSFQQLCKLLKKLTLLTLFFIFLTIVSVFTIGISRVTCNFGYIVWMISVTLVMTLLYLIIFDIILQTLLPSRSLSHSSGDNLEDALNKSAYTKDSDFLPIPVLADAVNMNGLVYFMIGNFLTGFVNIFLKPDSRKTLETNVILTIYLLLSTGFIFILYYFKIRIA